MTVRQGNVSRTDLENEVHCLDGLCEDNSTVGLGFVQWTSSVITKYSHSTSSSAVRFQH